MATDKDTSIPQTGIAGKGRHGLGPLPIFLHGDCYEIMLAHCRRKLAGQYQPGEDHDKKAFGLLAGRRHDSGMTVSRCFPLHRNARHDETQRQNMDAVMAAHAIPSETPFTDRGWVADPQELAGVLAHCRSENLVLIGAYHMHRVAWPHDPVRDTPTELDKILGQGSRLVMFIISMVDPDRPLLRAFSEGDPDREFPIHEL